MTFNFNIAGGWLIDLTGITNMESVDEFITYINEDENTFIELWIYDIVDKKGSDVENVETLLTDMYDTSTVESLETEAIYSNMQIAGKAIVYYCIDKESNVTYWMLEDVKVKGTQYLLSRMFYPTEEYKTWAIRVWNSIIKLEDN